MNCGIIYNAFYKGASYLNNIALFEDGIKRAGHTPITMTNAQMYNTNRYDFDIALFLDKDLNLAYILEKNGVRLFNSADTIRICDDKALMQVYLNSENVPSPKTYIPPFTFSNIGYPEDFFTHNGSYPIIIKETKGSFGKQVHLAKDKNEYNNIIRRILPNSFIVQEYFPEGYSDTRVFVLGGRAICAMQRTNTGDFRSNAELGGICSSCELTEDAAVTAELASKAVGADFCGVDLVKHNDKHYVIEVNSNSMINNLVKYSGVDVPLEVAKHITSS